MARLSNKLAHSRIRRWRDIEYGPKGLRLAQSCVPRWIRQEGTTNGGWCPHSSSEQALSSEK